jgi:hypothetical protein
MRFLVCFSNCAVVKSFVCYVFIINSVKKFIHVYSRSFRWCACWSFWHLVQSVYLNCQSLIVLLSVLTKLLVSSILEFDNLWKCLPLFFSIPRFQTLTSLSVKRIFHQAFVKAMSVFFHHRILFYNCFQFLCFA